MSWPVRKEWLCACLPGISIENCTALDGGDIAITRSGAGDLWVVQRFFRRHAVIVRNLDLSCCCLLIAILLPH